VLQTSRPALRQSLRAPAVRDSSHWLATGSHLPPDARLLPGRMAERTKATVLKTVRGASPSWVRIPLLPLHFVRFSW
jgi:hypothetical protein